MTSDNNVVHLKDYRPTPYLIEQTDLTFRLEPNKTRVTARLSLSPREDTQAGTPLELVGDDLILLEACLDGVPLDEEAYTNDPGCFLLKKVPEGAFTLELVTEIDPENNSQLMGLYRSNGTYCTQCESEGFRRITYFYDRPDVLSVYTVRIEAQKSQAPILLSNGNPVEAGIMPAPEGSAPGSEWHFAVWQDPFPKPSYLFAMVAGDLACCKDQFKTVSGRNVELRIYVEHGKEDRVDYTMGALKRAMAWDEKVFGREYDLDIFMIVAVSYFNMGAMENKGLNVFNDKYVLAKPETATDTDYAMIEGVIGHEYFHNWTGDRITCRDWFQLCLKEGLTVFRDQEFSSDMRSRPVKRIADVQLLRARQFPEDGGPLAHPVRPESYTEINNFYTMTVYEKGAELCRMIKTILGDGAFFKGMDLYFERHDGQAVTIEDFLKAFEDASGQDLTQFSLWYSQSGTPSLAANYTYDAIAKTLSLSIEQSCPPTPGQPNKKPMLIPVRFGLIARNGGQAKFECIRCAESGEVLGDSTLSVLQITKRRHSFVFEGVDADALPSLLRDFSAPVHLHSNLTLEDHLCLMRHDSDPFNRWQSLHRLLMDHLVATSRSGQALEESTLSPALIEAIGSMISDESLEPAFRAQLLSLPSSDDVAREIGKDVNPDSIYKAGYALRRSLAKSLRDDFVSLYNDLDKHLGAIADYRPDALCSGQRALKNRVLGLLMSLKDQDLVPMAINQFENANNMTDQIDALAALTSNEIDKAEGLLAAFYDTYAQDPLVIDKWFALQATMPGDETPARIRQLMKHEAFSMKNPNRVRSLVGAFAMNNPAQFARSDGEGFALVADVILDLQASNPQTAASLSTAFRSWRMLEAARAEAAKTQLNRINSVKSLSKDVADIVNRCLQ